MRRRNVRKRKKEDVGTQGLVYIQESRRGSVSDRISENKRERRWGSVRGNCDQEIGVSKERPRHPGRFKNNVEGIGSMDIA